MTDLAMHVTESLKSITGEFVECAKSTQIKHRFILHISKGTGVFELFF